MCGATLLVVFFHLGLFLVSPMFVALYCIACRVPAFCVSNIQVNIFPFFLTGKADKPIS